MMQIRVAIALAVTVVSANVLAQQRFKFRREYK